MLKLKWLFENYDLAKECLRLYDHREEGLDKMLAHFRISSNAIYPFRSTAGTVCFLRLSPLEEKPTGDVLSELRLIEWLIDNGYPAMRPCPMHDGSTCTVLDTRWGAYNVSCFEAVPGNTLEDCEGTPGLVRGYGKTLGRLHALMKRYPYADTRRDHTALTAEIRERFKLHGAPDALLREWDAVTAGLAELERNNDTYGVIHYDFEADNVLWDDRTDSYGVIDFDDAIRCWYALDVARAVDCLDDVDPDLDPAEAKALLLAGYREETPFTDGQEATLPLMRRLVSLQEYGTILHALSDCGGSEPDWMTTIIGKLTGKLRSIEERLR